MNFWTNWVRQRRLREQLRQKNRKWRNSLKGRTRDAYEQYWNCSDVHADDACITEIAKIMSLPSVYLYPDDKLSDILFNPYSDFSDVEAIDLMERKLGVRFHSERLGEELENMLLKDVFPKSSGQK